LFTSISTVVWCSLPPGIDATSHDSGQPADVVESAYWHNNDAICRGEMSMTEFNAALAEKTTFRICRLGCLLLAAVEAMPEMHELVNWASERYGVGLLTNIMRGWSMPCLNRGSCQMFAYDAVVEILRGHAIKQKRKYMK